MDETQIKKSRKLQKDHKKDDQKLNFLDQLPQETVMDILSRLPITSLIQFSFVSLSSNSLISHHPHLANMRPSPSSSTANTCLLFHSDYPLRNRLHFLRLSDRKVKKIDTPFVASMPEFTILGSSNGLLCLLNSFFPESIHLYNPFTRSHSELPKNFTFQDHDHTIVYGFGFHPTTKAYKVVKIGCYSKTRKEESEVEIYSSSSNAWKSSGVLLPYRLEKWSSPGVLVSLRLHWVSRLSDRLGRAIVSFDLCDDSFHMIRAPTDGSGSFGRWVGCNLGALDRCLCAVVPVHLGHGALDVWVMKEYGVDESWVKEYSIGVHYPVSMISYRMETSSHIWTNMFGKKLVRILCVWESSGELVLEYKGGGLVSYDLCNRTFKELLFPGIPKLYQTIVHVGTLHSAILHSIKT